MMFRTVISLGCLAAEANLVIGLRLQRLSFGGMTAFDESVLMVSEKVQALQEACTHLASGCSFDSVVSDYRAVVHKNVLRLSS